MPQTVSQGGSRDVISGVAIPSLIFLVSGWLPIIGVLGLLTLPLPIFYYRAKLGRKRGLFILAAAMAVVATAIGRLSPDLMIVAGLLMTGFVLCELVEKGMSIERTVLFTGGLVYIVGVLGLLVYSNMAGAQPGALLAAYVEQNLALSLKLYEEVGMPPERVHLIAQSLGVIQYYLIRILPSLSGAFLLLVAWITFLGARTVLTRKGVGFPDFGHLNTWHAPEAMVWGVIGCGGLLFFPYHLAKVVALNGLILLMTVYFFQGIAVISYFFEKKELPLSLRVLIYSLIAFWYLPLVLVVGLGFFDMWADFRRLRRPVSDDPGPEE